MAGAAHEKDMTQNGTVAGNGTHTDSLKIVIVGDGGCGKTSLLMVYAKGDFPEVSFLMIIKLTITILRGFKLKMLGFTVFHFLCIFLL